MKCIRMQPGAEAGGRRGARYFVVLIVHFQLTGDERTTRRELRLDTDMQPDQFDIRQKLH